MCEMQTKVNEAARISNAPKNQTADEWLLKSDSPLLPKTSDGLLDFSRIYFMNIKQYTKEA
jgi:hypothetical protein